MFLHHKSLFVVCSGWLYIVFSVVLQIYIYIYNTDIGQQEHQGYIKINIYTGVGGGGGGVCVCMFVLRIVSPNKTVKHFF